MLLRPFWARVVDVRAARASALLRTGLNMSALKDSVIASSEGVVDGPKERVEQAEVQLSLLVGGTVMYVKEEDKEADYNDA